MEREQLVNTVLAAQKGDSAALNILFNAFYNDVYYFALKTVKDQDLAFEVTQESFVEIINTLGDLKEPAAFVTWMKQITYHQCTRYFKKKKDVIVDEDEDGNTIFDTLAEDRTEFIPDAALDQEDFRRTILAMLDQLSEEQRSATMMYYFDELPVKQIAQIQGVSEGTVKSRLNYARKSIKASVESYEKKTGIKLHSFGFVPLFVWLFRGSFAKAVPAATAQTMAAAVSAATGTTVSVAAVAAGAATATASTAATATVTTSVAAKIVACVVAASLVVGGGFAASKLSPKDKKQSSKPVAEEKVEHSESQSTYDKAWAAWKITFYLPVSGSAEKETENAVTDEMQQLLQGMLQSNPSASMDEETYEQLKETYRQLWEQMAQNGTTGQFENFDQMWDFVMSQSGQQLPIPGDSDQTNNFQDTMIQGLEQSAARLKDMPIHLTTRYQENSWRLYSMQSGQAKLDNVIEQVRSQGTPEQVAMFEAALTHKSDPEKIVFNAVFNEDGRILPVEDISRLPADHVYHFLTKYGKDYGGEMGDTEYDGITLEQFNEITSYVFGQTYEASEFTGLYAVYHPDGDYLEKINSDSGENLLSIMNMYTVEISAFRTGSPTKPEGEEGVDYIYREDAEKYLLYDYTKVVIAKLVDGQWMYYSFTQPE